MRNEFVFLYFVTFFLFRTYSIYFTDISDFIPCIKLYETEINEANQKLFYQEMFDMQLKKTAVSRAMQSMRCPKMSAEIE